MKREDRELLLKDLCARLPYGVIVQAKDWTTLDTELKTGHIRLLQEDYIELKPYLRPMSSMTEKEKKELGSYVASIMFASQNKNHLFQLTREALVGDFFNEHHIDYRGLSENDLAIEAPEGMYNLKVR